jgi:hypothetical protein
MSELDVIVIHIRAEQAAEYERLFAERELPRWREYKELGAFISARMFRAAFGTDGRQDIAKYVIAVELPSHAEHSEHDADPGFRRPPRAVPADQDRAGRCRVPETAGMHAERAGRLSAGHPRAAEDGAQAGGAVLRPSSAFGIIGQCPEREDGQVARGDDEDAEP